MTVVVYEGWGEKGKESHIFHRLSGISLVKIWVLWPISLPQCFGRFLNDNNGERSIGAGMYSDGLVKRFLDNWIHIIMTHITYFPYHSLITLQ